MQPFRSPDRDVPDGQNDGDPVQPLPWSTSTALVATVFSVALGIGAGPVWAVVAG